MTARGRHDRPQSRGNVTESLDQLQPPDRWIDVGTVLLRCRIEGGGPPVVLIHELGGSLESWDGVVPALAPDHLVIRYDQRCAGGSEKTDAPFDAERLSVDLLRLLRELGISRPVHLIGAAFGAAQAVIVAAKHPEVVASVTMLAPALDIGGDSRAIVAQRADRAVKHGMRSVEQATLDRAWPRDRRADVQAFDTYRARYLSADPRAFARHNHAIAALDLGDTITRINAPVLVIAGKHDRVRPPQVLREQTTRISGARLVEIDAAHFMAVEAPRDVIAPIREFLLGLQPNDAHAPRLHDVTPEELSAAQRDAITEAVAGARGRVPAPMRAWLASPELARRAQALGETVRYRTSLTPRLSELAILVMARLWRSEYEWRVHAAAAADAGLADWIITQLRSGALLAGLADDEQAVIDVAVHLHRERRLTDEVFQRAERTLGRAGLAELIGLFGYYTLVSMTLNTYEIGLTSGAQPLFSASAPPLETKETDA